MADSILKLTTGFQGRTFSNPLFYCIFFICVFFFFFLVFSSSSPPPHDVLFRHEEHIMMSAWTCTVQPLNVIFILFFNVQSRMSALVK
ncbi:hypothetical protein PO909_023998 [Leuciscus waleckii]